MKKENNLITFLKGAVIGLGVVFPVSSSVLAIAMGIYERILDTINNLFSKFKVNFKFIFFLGFGAIFSALVSSLFLDFTLDKFPIATMLFFIGLVVGGLPILTKKVKGKCSILNIILLILGASALLGLSFMTGNSNAIINTSISSLIKLFGVGILGAVSMIVPGISGAVMLVILGYYEPLLEVISSAIKFQNLMNNIIIIGIFGFGMLVGVILASKVMEYLLKKYEVKSYFVIIGFIIASVMQIVLGLFNNPFNICEILVGVLLFICGFLVSFKYLKEE